jgi:acetyl esterase/lipase
MRKKADPSEEAPPILRRSDAWAALLLLALAVAPWLPPAHLLQWKLQLVLTEKGVWFGGAGLVGALAVGVRRRRGLSSLFLAAVFLLAAFLFFRPWWQFLAERPLWRTVMGRVFGTVEPPPLADQAPKSRWLDIARPDGTKMRVLYFPPAARPGSPAPWVVVAHTGGWDGGSPQEFTWMNSRLARRGWAVAAPDYGLAPGVRWPAPREDVLLTARYFKENASSLGLDPSRWVLFGRSAGGQIAEAAALASPDPTLRGLIAFYAPADLLFAYEYGREDDVIRSPALIRQLLGGTPLEKPDLYRDASPYAAVSPAAPPTLLIHGPRDTLTWVRQSRRFAGRLAEAKVKMVLIEPPWATHGFDYFPSGPGGRAAIWAVEHFLTSVFGEMK